MPFNTSEDLRLDVLFRAGESPGASDWSDKVMDYLNRVYKALCLGATEFLPEYVDDWWWMRQRGILIIEPVYNVGTVDVQQFSQSVTFSSLEDMDISGWFLRVDSEPNIYQIKSDYIIGSPTADLDMEYLGAGNSAAMFKLMKLVYALPANVAAIMSPIISFTDNPGIMGLSPERMEVLFPMARLTSGVAKAFSLENETTIRFSHGGRIDGQRSRMEFIFKPLPTDLINSPDSVPLVPAQYRHLLGDMALTYLLMDKNDDRAQSSMQSARAGLQAMVRENRRRIQKMDLLVGKLQPRHFYRPKREIQVGEGGAGFFVIA